MRLWIACGCACFCLLNVALASSSKENPGIAFGQLVASLKKNTEPKVVTLTSGKATYELRINARPLQDKIRGTYTQRELAHLRDFLAPITAIALTSRGLVKAAERGLSNEPDPTHYDAVWLRDSLWAYLSLEADPKTRPDAGKLLRALLSYMSSQPQLARFEAIIANPKLLATANAPMEVPHIRFNGADPNFADVLENGAPQRWNHKQNDALGLFFDLFLRAIQCREIEVSALDQSARALLVLMPAYFHAIRFWEMEDAGAWEEIERINSSSIGLVTSGLERLVSLVDPVAKQTYHKNFAAIIAAEAKRKGFVAKLDPKIIAAMVSNGYERVRKQIKAGGESPLYPPNSMRYRKADAALLVLLYPAELKELSVAERLSIVDAISPLIGNYGIKRYEGDSYQSGNFWFQAPPTGDGAPGKTDDTSSAKDFAERGSKLLKDSEAEWFFDSWLSLVYGRLYAQTKNETHRDLQLKHFNRALAQITGGTKEQPMLGADGRPVPILALPESYNAIVQETERFAAPSPITPLNWAKACLSLALAAL